MEFINKTSLNGADFFYLTNKIPSSTSLLDLMVWSNKQSFSVLDVIKLDEYTFDVIMPWKENLFLIIDVT